jgi:acyl-CoA thioesterase-2
MPEVPRPQDCGPRETRDDFEDSLMRRIDMRLARGRRWQDFDATASEDGVTMMWARMPEVIEGIDAAALAILGDYVPMGCGQALGRFAGGNSLDNTLRVGRLVPTEWVLLDIKIHQIANGFGHGRVHMWAEDGTLLATASQSCIVRFWKNAPTEPGRAAR